MISYQWTLTSKVVPCDRPTFAQILISDIVMNTCAEVTRLRRLELAATDEAERRRLHDEQGKLKRRLPAFLFMASFPGGRRRQSDAVLTGLVMLDFDNLDDPRAAFNRIKDAGDIERLGILLAHITPSGMGLRIVAKADSERGNLADNQHYIANEIGLGLDEACKDASRISYAFPLDYLLYEDKELFTYENTEFENRFGTMYRGGVSAATADDGVRAAKHSNEADGDGHQGGGQPDGQSDGQTAAIELPRNDAGEPVFCGITYKAIIAEWWRQQAGQPVVGERNQKLHRLAAHLRYICDNSPSALMQVMPTYGLPDDEVRQLCESACKLKMYGGRPKALTKVLEALGIGSSEDEGEDDKAAADMNADFRRRLDSLRLPPALKAVMQGVPDDVKIGALLAALPMFYTLASRVTFTHFDGSETRLSGMTFVVGPAASGKSFILELDRLLMEPIRIADKAGRKTEQEYRESKELNKNKQKQMEKPHPVIRITPIQISNTMLALRMRDAVDQQDPSLHLHIYSCEAELATALRAQKGGSWIEKNDLYCKSFHNEMWGMDYANDQAINGEIQVNLNLVVSGTEDAFDKLIPTNTILSGLPTRLMYFPMPSTHYKMIDKGKKRINATAQSLLTDTAYYLDTVRGHLDAHKLTDCMYRWCERIARRAEIEQDEELDDLRKRTAIIGERAGVAFALIACREDYEKGKPLKFDSDALKFAEFVADYCLYTQYAKFAPRMKEQKQRVKEISGKRGLPMRLAEVYNALPKVFTLDDLKKQRPGATRNTLYMNIHRWKDTGLITADNKKYTKKIIKI